MGKSHHKRSKASKGKHVAQGRNYCTLPQQEVVTPLYLKKSAPYTQRGTSPSSSTTSSVSPTHKLTDDERIECWRLYVTWVLSGRKMKDSPLPMLKAKYKACERPTFFSEMVQRSIESGSIFRKSGSGRPVVYDPEVFDPIIKECLDSQRAKQRAAPPSLIRKYMIDTKLEEVPSEEWIRLRKLELGVVTVIVKRKPMLTTKLMMDRKSTARDVIDFNEDPLFLCVSYDQTNVHETPDKPIGACFEVLASELDDVPDVIRFAPISKETLNQEVKVMFGAALCPKGTVYLERYDFKAHWKEQGISKKGVTAAYLIATDMWGKIHRTAKAMCVKGQRPFLWLDRATPHTAKVTQAELDRVWGSDCWTYQAGKMPDSNDGDVAAFPFLKRHLKDLGELSTPEEIAAGFKEAWKALTPAVCTRIRARVVRNMRMVIIKQGGNYYDESMTQKELGI
jgi:hypothetical protein